MKARQEEPRSIDVLLMIVGAVDGVPIQMGAVAEAYDLGVITPAEAKALQRYTRLSPRGRKAAAVQSRDVSDAEVEQMKANLARELKVLEERHPQIRSQEIVRRAERGDDEHQ